MKPKLRPSRVDEVFAALFPPTPKREVQVNPEGGFFETRDLEKALKRAGRQDAIILPPGRYTLPLLTKSLEIRAEQPGTVVLDGTVSVQGIQVLLRGLQLQSGNNPAIQLQKGDIFLDNCVVHGKIDAAGAAKGSRVLLRNCLVQSSPEGIVLGPGVEAELTGSVVRDCLVGVSAREGATFAIYHSRIEACRSSDASHTCAGIYAEKASLYCEGITFLNNSIGVYLKRCTENLFIYGNFQNCQRAGIIYEAESSQPGNALTLHSCTFERQKTSDYPQLSLAGGNAFISHTVARSSEATALAAFECNLTLQNCQFSSSSHAAVEVRDSVLKANAFTCASESAATFVAENSSGSLTQGVFVGQSPVLATSPTIALTDCREEQAHKAKPARSEKTDTFEDVVLRLRQFVGQQSPRNDLERVLRQAQASRQRVREGLPAFEQSFHSIFTGPPATGKLAAAKLLTEGLHAIGVVKSPNVAEIPVNLIPEFLGRTAPTKSLPDSGALFIRLNSKSSSGEMSAIEELLMMLPQDIIIILEGEREPVRRLVRSQYALENAFTNSFHFTVYSPPELADLFAQLCERDRIHLGLEASQKLLLAFHIFADRHDKRYAHTQGVKALYSATHRRYLERCSLANRFDLDLIPADLNFGSNTAERSMRERSPWFVSTCPKCQKENPWLPGMHQPQACLHCETVYEARWGTWKSSTYYRRKHDASLNIPQTGAVASRLAHLPSRRS